MRINESNVNDVLGKDVHGADGRKIGEVCQLFLDAVTGAPEWVTVKTGIVGTKESFVPIAQAQLEGDFLTVPYDEELVKGAPTLNVDTDHLSKDEEAELYRHYGLDYFDVTATRTATCNAGVSTPPRSPSTAPIAPPAADPSQRRTEGVPVGEPPRPPAGRPPRNAQLHPKKTHEHQRSPAHPRTRRAPQPP